MGAIEIVLIILVAISLLISLMVFMRFSATQKEVKNLENILSGVENDMANMVDEIKDSRMETISYINNSFKNFGDMVASNQRETSKIQDQRLGELNEKFHQMHVENNQHLEKMRQTVDEKLQKTLEDRIGQSFKLVSDRLEQVYKGLGEMQTLATGVGDLKKVLSNVKTRGILGEIQLGAILEQILAPEQYEENVKTRSTGNERVEFAVKLPGDDEKEVYLPIDAKFPGDAYARLVDAYDKGDSVEIELAGKALETIIKKEAKDIKEKYIEPPYTTDFGIMFLPFEGLYAEVVRRGLVETLQREYKINIAGPTTMAALLNSLQMGFKTLAIQKHSSQVWDILGAVKTEFDKFGTVLAATQNRINQANQELDKLVGTRTRMIQNKLRKVTTLSDPEAINILDDGE